MNTKILSIEKLNKTFLHGKAQALKNCSLEVSKNSITGLLGMNGAGKTTLIKCVANLLIPDSGSVYFENNDLLKKPEIVTNNISVLLDGGRNLFWYMTVEENIKYFSLLKAANKFDKTRFAKIAQYLELEPILKKQLHQLSFGMKQRANIAVALMSSAQLLIFDEPTAVLTPAEISELMQIMKNLIKEGKSIILITHKLDEIRAVADRITVIRRGKSIDTVELGDKTNQELAELMVGRSVSFITEKAPAQPKDIVLEIKDLNIKESRGSLKVKGLSLDVRAGEIVGVAGIDGNGQTELVKAITGLTKVDSGSIKLHNKDITNQRPRKITEQSVGHVPEDRHRDGLVLEMTVAENIALQTYYKPPMSKYGFLDYNQINSHARKLMEEFDVRGAGEWVSAASLSGGNQQKAIIAREIDRNPDLLIVSQPTRGLDVGAIEYIHKRLIQARDEGKAVLVISFELDEILNVSDRIAVIHDGQIQGIVRPESTTKQELGILMVGGNINE